jgi:hypothetical protein
MALRSLFRDIDLYRRLGSWPWTVARATGIQIANDASNHHNQSNPADDSVIVIGRPRRR